jgi:WXG100 family type VII secretion target
MTQGFDTTPQQLTQTATDCDTMATTMDNELAAIKTYVLGLNGPWLGAAQQEFETLMGPGGPWESNTRGLHQALTSIAVGLRQNATNYHSGESVNSVQITSITDAFPPANL